MEWIEQVKNLGIILGTGGTLGAFLAWIYKKMVSEPNQQSYAKLQMEYTRVIADTLTPLTYQIKSLNDTLTESKEDRKKIHELIDEHEDILTDHETRITVLEKTGGGK